MYCSEDCSRKKRENKGKHPCPDCGKEISCQAKRCQSCASKVKFDSKTRHEISDRVTEQMASPDVRHNLSKKAKARWASGHYDTCFFKHPTKIEAEVYTALEICGIEYQAEYRPPNCCFVYDVFISPNILIEAHGDYWHGPDHPENQARDAEKAKWAREKDYILIVVWEREIKEQGAWSLLHERILPLF